MRIKGRQLLIIALILSRLILPVWVLAQSVTDTPTPTVTPVDTTTPIVTPTDTPTPTVIPTDTPTITPTPTVTPVDTTTPTVIPTDTPTPTDSLTPTPTLVLDTPIPTPVPANATSSNTQNNTGPSVQNNASVSQNVIASSNSGGNVINQGTTASSTVVTGNAVAIANIVNLVNTNNINSSVQVYLVNDLTGQVQQIDLNSAWNLLGINSNSTSPNGQIFISNNGTINNQVTVSATSGNNIISGGGTNIVQTGNAYSLANIINLLNSNVIDSKLLLGIININGSTLGDIILPNPSNFGQSNGQTGVVSGQISNTALINNNTVSTANSGNNQIVGSGNNIINTGNASAVSQNLTTTNINDNGGQNMILGLNTLGNWTGSIYNWGQPGSTQIGGMTNLFVTGIASVDGNLGGFLTANINNGALIQNNVTVKSDTGGNMISSNNGSSTISTGNAWSLANVTNIANLNLFNSSWFYGIINVIGDWKGNAIFAYPDLTVSTALSQDKLNIGDQFNINVDYGNIGYDADNQANIEMNLPVGVSYLGDNSGIKPTINGQTIIWPLSNIQADSDRSFTVSLKVNFVSDNQTSTVWQLIKPAFAAEIDKQITIITNISSAKAEVSVNNNSATAVATVVVNGTSTDSTTQQGNPNLFIDVSNNVNDYVYPGDIVTFAIKAKNNGEATAHKTYIIHRTFDAKGKLLDRNVIKVGDATAGKSGQIHFGIPVSKLLKINETLTTETIWIGTDDSGNTVKSNVVNTSFKVVSKFFPVNNNSTVQAVSEQQILGVTTASKSNNVWLYLVLFASSGSWLMLETAKRLKIKNT